MGTLPKIGILLTILWSLSPLNVWALDCPSLEVGMGCELHQRTDLHGSYTLRLQYNRLMQSSEATVLWLGAWASLANFNDENEISLVERWSDEAALRTLAIDFDPPLSTDRISVERYLQLLTELNTQQHMVGSGALTKRIQVAVGEAATLVALAMAQQVLPLQQVILLNGPMVACDGRDEMCDEAEALMERLLSGTTRRRIPELTLQTITHARHLSNRWNLQLHERWFQTLQIDCKSRLIFPETALSSEMALSTALHMMVTRDPCDEILPFLP